MLKNFPTAFPLSIFDNKKIVNAVIIAIPITVPMLYTTPRTKEKPRLLDRLVDLSSRLIAVINLFFASTNFIQITIARLYDLPLLYARH